LCFSGTNKKLTTYFTYLLTSLVSLQQPLSPMRNINYRDRWKEAFVPKTSSIRPVVSIQYRLVSCDRRTDRLTHDDRLDSKYRASIASRDKKQCMCISVCGPDRPVHVCEPGGKSHNADEERDEDDDQQRQTCHNARHKDRVQPNRTAFSTPSSSRRRPAGTVSLARQHQRPTVILQESPASEKIVEHPC